jgi:hypothetical protein
VTADQGYSFSIPVTFVVGELTTGDPMPDGPRIPALYYAYDNTDTGFPQHPTYNWVEINAKGTQITYPQNDMVIPVTIPSAFGPFKFYGQSFSQLCISADGWICPGFDTTSDYSNSPLPDPSTPTGMICANWDDLKPEAEGLGYVYYYHDTLNHRFIIEYDSVRYYHDSLQDKFEVILYDSTVPTGSDDNAILVQYMTANGFQHSTLGIEDPSKTIAIQALYNGVYHRACAPIAAGRAILYVTDYPYPTGIADPQQASGLRPKPLLMVYPNPVADKGTVLWTVKTEGKVTLKLYDASGREIRRLVDAQMKPGRYTASWDGRAANGKKVAEGVYFYRLETAAGTCRQKVVVTK